MHRSTLPAKMQSLSRGQIQTSPQWFLFDPTLHFTTLLVYFAKLHSQVIIRILPWRLHQNNMFRKQSILFHASEIISAMHQLTAETEKDVQMEFLKLCRSRQLSQRLQRTIPDLPKSKPTPRTAQIASYVLNKARQEL